MQNIPAGFPGKKFFLRFDFLLIFQFRHANYRLIIRNNLCLLMFWHDFVSQSLTGRVVWISYDVSNVREER